MGGVNSPSITKSIKSKQIQSEQNKSCVHNINEYVFLIKRKTNCSHLSNAIFCFQFSKVLLNHSTGIQKSNLRNINFEIVRNQNFRIKT